MERERYNEIRMIRVRRGLAWLLLVVVAAIVGVGARWLQETNSGRDLPSSENKVGTLQQPFRGSSPSGTASAAGPRAVGTSGFADDAAAIDSPTVIHEIETITGANDGHELVGRRVSIHVPVLSRANDDAFWVGSKDNRLLVVMERDRRDEATRQRSGIAAHDIEPIAAGQQADITGTIQRAPKPEQMYSWGLTSEDKAELAARPIYLRADVVTPEAQGD